MAEEQVSGIALGLSLDTSGFSSGIARAKADLNSLQEAARNISIGVSVAGSGKGAAGAARGALPGPGVAVALPGGGPRISPRFAVSAGSVRDLRVDINRQMREGATKGELVNVGIKLGRIPYAQLRTQIEQGIGTITIRNVNIAPAAITAAARQLANPTVALSAAGAGVPKRAAGGAVSPPGTYIVGERRAEVFRPTVAGRIEQLQHAWTGARVSDRMTQRELNFIGNLRQAAKQMKPEHVTGGKRWYHDAGAYGRSVADRYGVEHTKALGVLAALSAATSWSGNKAKYERVLAAHSAGKPFPYESTRFDAHRKAVAILNGMAPEQAFRSSPKVGQFFRGISGDLSSLTLDRWATRTTTRGALDQPPKSMRPRMEKAWRRAAREHDLEPSEFQAALWLHEKEAAGRAGGGKVDAFGHPYRGSFSAHYGTRKHQAAMYPTYGRKMRGRTRPSWMVGEGQEPWEYDDDGNRVPMWRGGRARAYAATIEQGGGTFGKTGEQPSKGYAVGSNIDSSIVGAEDRLGFIRGFRKIQRSGAAPYTGTWLHEGNIHLDPATVYDEREAARAHARREGQLAFYNIGRGRELDTHPRAHDPIHGQMKLPGFARGGATHAEIARALNGRPSLTSMVGAASEKKELDESRWQGPWWTEPMPGAAAPIGKRAIRARPTKLPKGVKVRFSTEWSDYPDPANFLTSGGAMEGYERRTAPYGLGHDPRQSPGQKRLRMTPGKLGPAQLFNPGEADQLPTGFKSVSDWLQRGKVERGRYESTNARLAAYALDEKNRVLGHALFEAGVATAQRGPEVGKVATVLHPDYVWVNPALHGKGIASAMYARAERFTGMSTAPSGSQTAHGKRMWSGDPMARHFGRAFSSKTLNAEDRGRISTIEGNPAGPYASGWKAFEDEDAAEPFRDFSGAVDPVTRMRQRRVKGQMRLKGFAEGGKAHGTYIVRELGKELFVPTSKEHLIPPDVAAKIPGGGTLAERLARQRGEPAPEPWKPAWLRRNNAKDLTGRARGGMVEIGGQGSGPMVWQAPEDGWIIPNHLMNKVPRKAPGGPVAGQTGMFDDDAGAEQRARRKRDTSYQRARRARLAALTHAQELRESITPLGLGTLPTYEEQDTALAQARVRLGTTERGLSGRQGFGGLVRGALGGERRRIALQQGQYYEGQFQQIGQQAGYQGGAEAISGLSQQIAILAKESAALTDQQKGLPKTSKAFRDLAASIDKTNEHADKLAKDQVKLEDLKSKATEAFSKATSGALTNIASLTAAGFVYSTASQAVSAAAGLAVQSLSPIVDQLTGFSAVNTRVSKSLADLLPQAGNLETLFGQTGIQAGLSGGNADFLQKQLGGGIFAKAGAAKAGQADELFRAALGTGAPQGLLGGYGGVLGGAFLGEQLGGGKGLLETIAQTAAATTNTGMQAPSTDPFQVGIETLGKAFGGFASDMNKTGKGISSLISPEQTAKQAAVQKEQIDYVNEAIARGRSAAGETGAGPQLANVGVENADAQRIAADLTVEPIVRQLAQSGEVFRNARGDIITDLKGISDAASQLAAGLAIPDKAVFAKANAQQLRAQAQLGAAQGEFERGIAIPGQFGQQILANPFQSAAAGLEKGFKPTIANLEVITGQQQQLTQEAHRAVEEQAKFIDTNVGVGEGMRFRQDMQSVELYGKAITNINEQLANRQAQVSALQYGLSLKILSRNIADARGLAGKAGGSRLGRLEREQYQLGRQAGSLQLQSQGLGLQMNQREINFQTSLAGFQAVGISGEERAARMEEARAQAKYAQQQQDIATALYAIAQKQFGIEGQTFGIQAGRQVTDLEGQRAVLTASHALEQEQLAANKQIAVMSARQAKAQGDATSLFSQATGNFNNKLAVSAQYVAMYSGTLAAASKFIMQYVFGITGKGADTKQGASSPKHPGANAAGAVGFTAGEQQAILGEAGTEAYAILKNPRIGSIAPSSVGMGGGINVQIYVTGNSIRDDSDIDKLTRKIRDEVIDEIGRKAGMLSLAS